LIPDYLKLTKEDLTEDVIVNIEEDFIPTSSLRRGNCLHCNVYVECKNCPYYSEGQHCLEEGSLYHSVTQPYRYTQELYHLGQKLRKELDKEN